MQLSSWKLQRRESGARRGTIWETWSVGTEERYHEPLRSCFENIRTDMGKEEIEQKCLQIDLFAVTNKIGPEALCPLVMVLR